MHGFTNEYIVKLGNAARCTGGKTKHPFQRVLSGCERILLMRPVIKAGISVSFATLL